MPIKVTCPKCGGVLHAPDDAGGKRGRCPTCATVLNIPAEGASAAAATAGTADHPFRVSDGRPTPAPASAPSQAGGFGFSDIADQPRAAAGHVPPPSFHPPEARRPAPPAVTRTSLLPGPDDEPVDVAARGWRRVRRGLGWVRTGAVLLALAVIAPAAVVAVYDKSPGTLPDKSPGFLKIDRVSTPTEITAAAGLVPAALGLLAVVIGRFGVAGAPRSSYAGGLARLAAVGTVAAVGGLAAVLVPAGLLLSEGVPPAGLADRLDHEGMIQRFGLAAAVSFAVVAEAWFVIALGKIGAALHQRPASTRSGRLIALAGLVVVLAAAAGVGLWVYPADVNQWWAANVQPRWDELGANQTVAVAGAAAAAAFVAGVVYVRLVGAGRRAVREWLAQHQPA